MSTSTEDRSSRLFRTLVLMGSSLALGCGGVAERSAGEGSGSGGVTGSGGTHLGSGGVPMPDEPMSTGGLPTLVPGPFDCEPAQLTCTMVSDYCYRNDQLDMSGVQLPDSCVCDGEKPLSVEDCAEGEIFVCRRAVLDSLQRRFDRTVDFDCRCVADEAECSEACEWGCTSPDSAGGAGPTAPPRLCSCALPILR